MNAPKFSIGQNWHTYILAFLVGKFTNHRKLVRYMEFLIYCGSYSHKLIWQILGKFTSIFILDTTRYVCFTKFKDKPNLIIQGESI